MVSLCYLILTLIWCLARMSDHRTVRFFSLLYCLPQIRSQMLHQRVVTFSSNQRQSLQRQSREFRLAFADIEIQSICSVWELQMFQWPAAGTESGNWHNNSEYRAAFRRRRKLEFLTYFVVNMTLWPLHRKMCYFYWLSIKSLVLCLKHAKRSLFLFSVRYHCRHGINLIFQPRFSFKIP